MNYSERTAESRQRTPTFFGFWFFTTLAGLFSWSTDTRAGGFSVLDIGMRRCCMLAVMADEDEPSAIYHNPACLSEQEGTQLYFFSMYAHIAAGFELLRDDGSYTPEIKPTRSDGLAPFIGVTSDFDLAHWTFGSAVYFPNFYGASLPEDAPTRYHVYEAAFVTGYWSLSAAYEVTETLSLGATYNYIYVYLMGKRKMDLLGDSDPERDFDVTLAEDDSLSSWSLAMRYQPNPRWSFGLAFWPRSELYLTGDLDVDAPDGSPLVRSYINTSMLIPMSVRMGGSCWINPDWQVALDLNWWKYTDYREQKIRTGVDDLFGDMSSKKEYDDSYSIAVGAFHAITEKSTVMFGFLRDWSPIPEKYYSIDNPTSDIYSVSAGWRQKFKSTMQFTAGVSLKYYETVDITNSATTPPTNAKGNAVGYQVNFGLLYKM